MKLFLIKIRFIKSFSSDIWFMKFWVKFGRWNLWLYKIIYNQRLKSTLSEMIDQIFNEIQSIKSFLSLVWLTIFWVKFNQWNHFLNEIRLQRLIKFGINSDWWNRFLVKFDWSKFLRKLWLILSEIWSMKSVLSEIRLNKLNNEIEWN